MVFPSVRGKLGSFVRFAPRPTSPGLRPVWRSRNWLCFAHLTPPNWVCFYSRLPATDYRLLPFGFVLRISPSGPRPTGQIGFVSHNRLQRIGFVAGTTPGNEALSQNYPPANADLRIGITQELGLFVQHASSHRPRPRPAGNWVRFAPLALPGASSPRYPILPKFGFVLHNRTRVLKTLASAFKS
jgi:hypothetical protein